MRPANFLRILALASLLAAYSAWLQGSRPPAEARSLAVPVPTDGLPLVTRDEAESLHRRSGTVFLDVRPREDFRLGRLAGAISAPEEELPTLLPRLRPALERASAIVVYCKSRDCGKSLWAAQRLRNEGLTQTWIYPGGWNEWVNAGLPTDRE